jgi:hypothetical protein
MMSRNIIATAGKRGKDMKDSSSYDFYVGIS